MVTRSVSTLFAAALASAFLMLAQPPQPPPQPPPNSGTPRPLPGLTTAENAAFQEGLKRFLEIDSVTGSQPGTTGNGLGPTFNLNSCSGCHAQPNVGGSSPASNPEIAMAHNYGATNSVPSFIQADGPVRVVRFVSDGEVHSLFAITGREDAAGCSIAQPNFEAAVAKNNAVFRIPTPLYGAGLIESITDAAILTNKAANAAAKAALGITGHENRNANDGTICSFPVKPTTSKSA